MINFLANIKRYAWAIALFIITALGVVLGLKSREIEELKEEANRKQAEIETKKEELKEVAKRASFEVEDVEENLEVIKDFEVIDTQIKQGGQDVKKSNDDTFSFSV
jgi:predicted Holliday junction resolvase-like endonuclease